MRCCRHERRPQHGSGLARSPRTFRETFFRLSRPVPQLAFRDQAGRNHMTGTGGLEANYDNVEDLLRSLLDPKETVVGP